MVTRTGIGIDCLRVYDKGAESEGQLGALAWNCKSATRRRMRRRRSSWPPGSIAAVLAGRLAGFVDFRTGEGMVTRRSRAAWYVAVIGAVEGLRAYPPAEERTPLEVAEWLRRQAAPTMAALAERGELDIAFFLDDGQRRWHAKHHRLIARAL